MASSGGGAVASRSRAHRNAARVLPDPVGATTRACCPPATASHAPVWAAVGPSNAPVNQSRVAGEKRSRTEAVTSPMVPPTPDSGPGKDEDGTDHETRRGVGRDLGCAG